jgi:lysophospholipase L1-like esterase
MGSSFGAGPGLRPRADGSPRAARRSTKNYANIVAADRGLDLTDVTFSGATVNQLLHGGPGRGAAQLAAVEPDTSLVTITAGGNDLGYLGTLTFSSMSPPLRLLFGARGRIREFTDPELFQQRVADLYSDLVTLMRSIRAVAPDASILLVGYLTVLPAAGTAAGPIPQRIVEWGRTTAARLATVMADSAAIVGASFVDVGAASAGHDAWSAEPWTNGFSLTGGNAPYHPNELGMRRVAELVEREL